jgi:hypothetical protein
MREPVALAISVAENIRRSIISNLLRAKDLPLRVLTANWKLKDWH